MMEPFPKKAKDALADYERLWREHHEAKMEHLPNIEECLDKLERRL
jgi:hypothetical protein